jgi:hypothetical protein
MAATSLSWNTWITSGSTACRVTWSLRSATAPVGTTSDAMAGSASVPSTRLSVEIGVPAMVFERDTISTVRLFSAAPVPLRTR